MAITSATILFTSTDHSKPIGCAASCVRKLKRHSLRTDMVECRLIEHVVYNIVPKVIHPVILSERVECRFIEHVVCLDHDWRRSMTDQFDIVVAGGGHNSLVTAAYLAMAGYSCLVLEARPMIG